MENSPYSLKNYDYFLPQDRIAREPVVPRDISRLLVLNRSTKSWKHLSFKDLPSLLEPMTTIVANNTRVLRARLLGRRLLEGGAQGGKIEFLMLEQPDPNDPLVWEGLFHASAKHRPGIKFTIDCRDGSLLTGEIVPGAATSPSGTSFVRFDRDPTKVDCGEVPLPHYIEHARDQKKAWADPSGANAQDVVSYQTVYAKKLGSAAAPTAGLHFTPELIQQLKAKNMDWQEITLNVGIGTFRPVKAEDIRDHVMHEETYEVSGEVASSVTKAKKSNHKILAVGTTSLRTLESAWDVECGVLKPGPGRTKLFIYPDPRRSSPIRVVDQLITNFHLPQSTLLMLVCAFAGRDLVMAAYESAIQEGYRFFSYGDAMLIQ